MLSLTSDVMRAIREFLDFLLCEHAQDDDEVLALFEALVRLLQSFRVDEAAVDLGPAGTWRNTLLIRLCRPSQ